MYVFIILVRFSSNSVYIPSTQSFPEGWINDTLSLQTHTHTRKVGAIITMTNVYQSLALGPVRCTSIIITRAIYNIGTYTSFRGITYIHKEYTNTYLYATTYTPQLYNTSNNINAHKNESVLCNKKCERGIYNSGYPRCTEIINVLEHPGTCRAPRSRFATPTEYIYCCYYYYYDVQ